jgi:hypothetical protein
MYSVVENGLATARQHFCEFIRRETKLEAKLLEITRRAHFRKRSYAKIQIELMFGCACTDDP